MTGGQRSGATLGPPSSAPIVALLGDINVDVLLDVPALPGPGGDAIASGQRLELGGSASNTAVALARLGGQARMAGLVGADALADVALAALRGERVELTHVGTDPTSPTSMNIVAITPDGQRTMLAYRGANTRLAPDSVTDQFLDGAAALHLSGYCLLTCPQRDAAWKAVSLARARHVPITLDIPVAGAERAREETLRLLPQVSLVVVGEDEACLLAQRREVREAIEVLSRLGRADIALKRGALGSRLVGQRGAVAAPAMPVSVLDTTGAGDAFTAGLLHARTLQLDDMAALVLGNTLGALATTRMGAGTSLPSSCEVARALASAWTADPALAEAAGRAAAALNPAAEWVTSRPTSPGRFGGSHAAT